MGRHGAPRNQSRSALAAVAARAGTAIVDRRLLKRPASDKMAMMLPAQVIQKKRDGHALTEEEIQLFIRGFTRGELPDYQMAALAMAVCFQGMNFDETMWLTRAMVESGKVVQWKPGAFYADKHSTGGIGDKVSLILAPLVAACGVKVPMISGRGLGPTGGTLDKLESISGFRTGLSLEEFQRVTDE